MPVRTTDFKDERDKFRILAQLLHPPTNVSRPLPAQRMFEARPNELDRLAVGEVPSIATEGIGGAHRVPLHREAVDTDLPSPWHGGEQPPRVLPDVEVGSHRRSIKRLRNRTDFEAELRARSRGNRAPSTPPKMQPGFP